LHSDQEITLPSVWENYVHVLVKMLFVCRALYLHFPEKKEVLVNVLAFLKVDTLDNRTFIVIDSERLPSFGLSEKLLAFYECLMEVLSFNLPKLTVL